MAAVFPPRTAAVSASRGKTENTSYLRALQPSTLIHASQPEVHKCRSHSHIFYPAEGSIEEPALNILLVNIVLYNGVPLKQNWHIIININMAFCRT